MGIGYSRRDFWLIEDGVVAMAVDTVPIVQNM